MYGPTHGESNGKTEVDEIETGTVQWFVRRKDPCCGGNYTKRYSILKRMKRSLHFYDARIRNGIKKEAPSVWRRSCLFGLSATEACVT